MKYTEITVKEALHKLKRRGLPYKYDLNLYKGCSFACKYCYARKKENISQAEMFEEKILVKTNIAEVLEKELSSPGWKGDIINMGGVCDSYQLCEKDCGLVRDVLKVMIKYRNPVIISTKSDLVLRDLDLINELAGHAYVNIALCITSISGESAKNVEPGASSPEERLLALKEAGKTKAYTGMHSFPLLPFLADDESTLEILVKWASEADVSYMMTGVLYMSGGIKARYMDFIRQTYPQYYDAYKQLYPRGKADDKYKAKIHSFLADMRKKYNVNSNYRKFLPGRK